LHRLRDSWRNSMIAKHFRFWAVLFAACCVSFSSVRAITLMVRSVNCAPCHGGYISIKGDGTLSHSHCNIGSCSDPAGCTGYVQSTRIECRCGFTEDVLTNCTVVATKGGGGTWTAACENGCTSTDPTNPCYGNSCGTGTLTCTITSGPSPFSDEAGWTTYRCNCECLP
jgi:hypothetical protein